METIVTSQSTWIVEAISKIWEAMKINVKHWQILWGGSVLATTMECLLISSLNNLRNIIFFLFSFLKYRDFMFFFISIFIVVKERDVNTFNLSIHLPAIYLPICLYEVICPSFLKAVLSARTSGIYQHRLS